MFALTRTASKNAGGDPKPRALASGGLCGLARRDGAEACRRDGVKAWRRLEAWWRVGVEAWRHGGEKPRIQKAKTEDLRIQGFKNLRIEGLKSCAPPVSHAQRRRTLAEIQRFKD